MSYHLSAKIYLFEDRKYGLMFRLDLLWLSEDDVRSVLTIDDAIRATEGAFRDHGLGRVQMPPKSYLDFKAHNGDLRTMPAYLEGLDESGVKIVNSHAGNPDKGLPAVMAVLVLNSTDTGAPLALIGATFLTAIRTGAAGGIAAMHLARKDSRRVGLVGAGVQARTQLLALSRFFKIDEVLVADRQIERARVLVEDCRSFLQCDYLTTTSVKDACGCDILVTTTPSRKPIIRADWIDEGTHINAIGADAPGKQELEGLLLRRAKVVVDDMAQAVHSGEVNVPIARGEFSSQDIYAQIGEIVADLYPGRENDREITIFDSTGLAIQDVATGYVVYRNAMKAGIGSRMRFL